MALFSLDFIVPVYYSSNKETLLFYNPKDTYSTPDNNEFHQGLGIRHIFNNSYILGMNVFFDRRQLKLLFKFLKIRMYTSPFRVVIRKCSPMTTCLK